MDAYNKDSRSLIPQIFQNDDEIFDVYRKAENITAALFLITNLVPHEEAIKDALRKKALVVLNDVARATVSAVDVTELKVISSGLLHLSSLLDIAFWSGHISQMNAGLLQKEIKTVHGQVENVSLRNRNKFYIDQAFFNVRNDRLSADIRQKDNKTQTSQAIYKGQSKRQESVTSDTANIGQERQEKRQTIQRESAPANTEDYLSDNRSHRRDEILKLLKEKSNLSVKDFMSVIQGYSEKTIQRELLSLVDEGRVKKEGERRWSTYSLIVDSSL